jgi:hypothetical protein
MLAVDGCMLVAVGIEALADGPIWSFLLAFALGSSVLVHYGRRAAVAKGIRSRDETPHDWILALAIPGGIAGVLAAHTGRYGGFILMAYMVVAQVGERIAWVRFKPPSVGLEP